MALRRQRAGGAEAADGGAPDVFARAIDLLARRPHFRAELGRKLLARGFGAEEVDVALSRAADLGYLADETLAASYAAELAERRGLGRARIGRELARRGASEAAVERAVETISDAAELGRARDSAARWARRGAGDAAALARHLDRKGFARHVIFRILKEFAADAGDLPAADD